MRYIFFFLWLLCESLHCEGQARVLQETQEQLKAIEQEKTIARYFGGLYVDFLEHLDGKMQYLDTTDKELIGRFEDAFSKYYIEASTAFANREPVPTGYWSAYFSDTTRSQLQYRLLGANAHLNGELWKALTNGFTPEESQRIEDEFDIFRKNMKELYRGIYKDAYHESNKILIVHIATIGTAKWIGGIYLNKWINRQVKLARLYREKREKFNRVQNRVMRRKNFVDKLIIKAL